MNNILVISPSMCCESARFLAEHLDAKYENPYNTGNRDFTKFDAVFKYGFSSEIKAKKTFNKSVATNKAMNKITTLALFKDDKIAIQHTKDIKVVEEWIKNGGIAVARAEIDGHNGVGLTYCTTLKELKNTPAKFWTKYFDHTHEFRVNIWRGEVLAIYNKIQNDKEGHFKFVLYKGQEEHPQMKRIAQLIHDKVGLDFCGADIVCDKKGNLCLLEINSAPILFPYTAKKLAKKIEGVVNDKIE